MILEHNIQSAHALRACSWSILDLKYYSRLFMLLLLEHNFRPKCHTCVLNSPLIKVPFYLFIGQLVHSDGMVHVKVRGSFRNQNFELKILPCNELRAFEVNWIACALNRQAQTFRTLDNKCQGSRKVYLELWKFYRTSKISHLILNVQTTKLSSFVTIHAVCCQNVICSLVQIDYC